MARAASKDVPISFKQSIEICSFLRKKELQAAKKLMEKAIAKKSPVPFRRFTNGLGHKHGMASGRYPVKACTRFLQLLSSAEANAQQKGLNTSRLMVIHAAAQKASKQYHASRQRGRVMKMSHIEVVVQETRQSANPGSSPAPAAKAVGKISGKAAGNSAGAPAGANAKQQGEQKLIRN